MFRSFLHQALRTRGSCARAIFISGVTFGIGHIVNLLHGYSLTAHSVPWDSITVGTIAVLMIPTVLFDAE